LFDLKGAEARKLRGPSGRVVTLKANSSQELAREVNVQGVIEVGLAEGIIEADPTDPDRFRSKIYRPRHTN
jgi:hypothetical protein